MDLFRLWICGVVVSAILAGCFVPKRKKEETYILHVLGFLSLIWPLALSIALVLGSLDALFWLGGKLRALVVSDDEKEKAVRSFLGTRFNRREVEEIIKELELDKVEDMRRVRLLDVDARDMEAMYFQEKDRAYELHVWTGDYNNSGFEIVGCEMKE